MSSIGAGGLRDARLVFKIFDKLLLLLSNALGKLAFIDLVLAFTAKTVIFCYSLLLIRVFKVAMI